MGSTASIVSQLDDKLLSCEICFEKYSSIGDASNAGRHPKMLICLHCYCRSCCEGLSTMLKGLRITCPACRTITHLDDGGVDSLKNNYTLENLFGIMATRSNTSEQKISTSGVDENIYTQCGFCEEGNSMSANWGCMECTGSSGCVGLALCDECKVAHCKVRAFRSHIVLQTADFLSELSKMTKSRTPKCLAHITKDVEFYCETCSVLVCQSCIIGEHKGHDSVLLQEGAEAKRLGLMNFTAEIKARIAEFDVAEAEVKLRLESFKEEKESLHSLVDATMDEFASILSRKRLETHRAIEAAALGSVKRLQRQDDSLRGATSIIRRLTDEVETIMAQASDAEALESFDPIRTRLQTMIEQQNAILQEAADMNIGAVSIFDTCAHISDDGDADDARKGSGKRTQGRDQGQGTKDRDADESRSVSPSSAPRVDSKVAAALSQLCQRIVRQSSLCVPIKVLGQDKLGGPIGLACAFVGGREELFVSDFANNVIQVYEARSSRMLRSVGAGKGNGDNELTCPYGIAVHLHPRGVRDNIALARAHTLPQQVEGSGVEQGSAVVRRGGGIDTPSASRSSSIKQGSSEAGTQGGGGGARGDSDLVPILYVADFGNDRVQVLDAATGTFLWSIGSGSGPGLGQLSGPISVAVSDGGSPGRGRGRRRRRLDSSRAHVRSDDESGELSDKSSGHGECDDDAQRGDNKSPRSNVSNTGEEKNVDEEVEEVRGGGGGEAEEGGDGDDEDEGPVVYVAEYSNHRVQCFSAVTGKPLRAIGCGPGSASAQLNNPIQIALQGNRPRSRSRVPSSPFSRPSASLTEIFGQLGNEERVLLYVADQGNARVQVFDAHTGEHVRAIGLTPSVGWNPGVGSQLEGDVMAPTLPVDELGLIRRQSNNRLNRNSPRSGSLVSPCGLALQTVKESDGGDVVWLLVSDNSENCIQVYDTSSGAHVKTIGTGAGGGKALGQFDGPHAIVVTQEAATPSRAGSGSAIEGGDRMTADRIGLNVTTNIRTCLYVAEYSNRRVQVFGV